MSCLILAVSGWPDIDPCIPAVCLWVCVCVCAQHHVTWCALYSLVTLSHVAFCNGAESANCFLIVTSTGNLQELETYSHS